MNTHNISYEPMEVDLSAQSSNDMDISFNESINEVDEYLKKLNDSVQCTSTPSQTIAADCSPTSNGILQSTNIIKRFHIKMQKETESTFYTTKVKVTCAVLALLLSLIVYQVLNIQCSEDINTLKLRKSLLSKLYGQTKAIDDLIEGLSVTDRSKILIMVGSTGVGKTYAASTLLEHVGHYSNVYHYTMPSFMDTFTTDFMVGLTVCRNSIIIVDDLSLNDLDVKVHIDKLITKSNDLEKGVTVLLIYNCNPTKDIRQCVPTKIMDNFKDIEAYKKLIRFERLDEEHLRQCIETELGHRKITDNEFTRISKNFDVFVDGCKGVHTRMKLMDIS